MEKKLAFLFPGQGSQYVGMGKEFFDRFAVAKETFEEADEKLGRPLSRLIFEGPATDLTLTKNSQIAIYVVSVAIWRVLQQQFEGIKPAVCA
ncbi:MAG: ACP S-malonyltransferase [Simkania sp.]|nr:ACP S-malonyltransferase [Simkania sp.]